MHIGAVRRGGQGGVTGRGGDRVGGDHRTSGPLGRGRREPTGVQRPPVGIGQQAAEDGHPDRTADLAEGLQQPRADTGPGGRQGEQGGGLRGDQGQAHADPEQGEPDRGEGVAVRDLGAAADEQCAGQQGQPEDDHGPGAGPGDEPVAEPGGHHQAEHHRHQPQAGTEGVGAEDALEVQREDEEGAEQHQ